jgi:hypothetical protein
VVTSRALYLSEVTATAIVWTIAVGCSQPLSRQPNAAPMNRPVALGSSTGSGALEVTRRQLEGTWDLVTLEIVVPGGEALTPLKASGTLTYDDFGNLTIEARTNDPAAPPAALEADHLMFKGRAVIDPAKSELKMMDLTGNADPEEVLSPEKLRRFELGNDTLKLSSIDGLGHVTMVSTWHRQR